MARRAAPGPGQLQLPGIDHTEAVKRAISASRRAVKTAGRAVEVNEITFSGRNLRALSAAPIREELPPFRDFDSSRIAEAGYSKASHTLYVRFRDGTPWQYNNVEPQVWYRLQKSASPGRFVNRVLNNYSHGPSNF